MDRIELVVLGEPTAQKRHRHMSRGKFTRVYDPSSNDKGDFLSMIQEKAPETPWECPLKMVATFYFGRPKSHYKTGKNSHVLKDTAPSYHTSRPDFDNLSKFVMDAMSGVFFKDDDQICEAFVQKKYSDKPRVEILIAKLVHDPSVVSPELFKQNSSPKKEDDYEF